MKTETMPHKWALVRIIANDGQPSNKCAFVNVDYVVDFCDHELSNSRGEPVPCGKVTLHGGRTILTEEDFCGLAESLLGVEVEFDDERMSKGGIA